MAAILILAAATKLQARNDSPSFAIPTEVLAFFDVLAALVLARHYRDLVPRACISLMFGLFAAVSLRSALLGQTSCGCFGHLRTSPGWVAWGDAAACFVPL